MKLTGLISAVFAVATAFCTTASAHERALNFPATKDGRAILTVDLHTHTVFSDGEVWPSIRVEEAKRDGIDLLSITDHLEHQPKKADIPHPDRNRAHDVALDAAKRLGTEGLVIVRGAEITRNMPPGHVNAVFLKDANALLTADVELAIRTANEQGAFVFWNHPNWLPQSPDGVARMTDLHRRWKEAGLLHGVEVINGTLDGHSEHALQIALENNLTVLGTSDIHGLVDWTHNAGSGGHRPMTILLAKNGSESEMKKALFAGHTVAWSNDDLMGREDNVMALLQACLSLEAKPLSERFTVVDSVIRNACPINFTLRNVSEATFQNTGDLVRVERNGATPLAVRLPARLERLHLSFEVLNAQIGFRKSAVVSLSTGIPPSAPKPLR